MGLVYSADADVAAQAMMLESLPGTQMRKDNRLSVKPTPTLLDVYILNQQVRCSAWLPA
jgi:hypothetical protein